MLNFEGDPVFGENEIVDVARPLSPEGGYLHGEASGDGRALLGGFHVTFVIGTHHGHVI